MPAARWCTLCMLKAFHSCPLQEPVFPIFRFGKSTIIRHVTSFSCTDCPEGFSGVGHRVEEGSMSVAADARQARLRGALNSEQLGARGIERMARNPACKLLKALTIAGVSPSTVASAVYGDAAREGQSPFAL